MLLVSVKTYVALLCGISALFSHKSMSDSIPQTSDVSLTAKPNLVTLQPMHAGEVNKSELQPGTWHPTVNPAEAGVSTAAQVAAASTVQNEEVVTTYRSDSASALVARNTATATTVSSSGLHLRTATTGGGEAEMSSNMTTSETAKPTEEQSQRLSPPTSTDETTPPDSVTTPHKQSVSSLQPTSITNPEVPPGFSSTASPTDSTTFSGFIGSPSASATSGMSGNTTSKPAVAENASSPVTAASQTPTNNPKLSATSQTVLVKTSPVPTSHFAGTGTPSSKISISNATANTTTAAANSTSPPGIFIHYVTKQLPDQTTKASKCPPAAEDQRCFTRGVVKPCLIAIAALAGLATIFMVSTIVLCAKLSARKYKVKKPKQATEMMCISSLLPERNYSYTRQRNPVSNGVLVIHGGRDSDEDLDDNLTLSSFLPENDRFV